MQISALHRAQSCLPPRSRERGSQQTARSTPPFITKALPRGAGTAPRTYERGKKKLKCHARDSLQMGSKPESPKAKRDFSQRWWHAARLPGFRAAEKSPIALFGGVQCLVAPSYLLQSLKEVLMVFLAQLLHIHPLKALKWKISRSNLQ